MPIAVMPPVRICHALKCFYFGIDMLNDNPSPRKFFVIRFFPFGQLMVFTRLYRNEAGRMIELYPKVSKISVNRYRIADSTPDTVLKYRKIMLASIGL